MPSLALGTGVVTPLELTAAYAMFPARRRVVDTARRCVGARTPTAPRCSRSRSSASRVSPSRSRSRWSACCATSSIAGPAAPARALGVRGPVGGKTGTTDDYHDAWFVGFSSAVVAGVWVGFDQPAPIGRDAYARARGAADLGRLHEAHRDGAAGVRVRGARRVSRPSSCAACRTALPVDGCPRYTEYFKDGDDMPSALCPIHQGSFKERTARAVGRILQVGLGEPDRRPRSAQEAEPQPGSRPSRPAPPSSDLPFLHLPQRPPIALVGRARRRDRGAIHPLDPPQLDLLGRRFRRQILVERAARRPSRRADRRPRGRRASASGRTAGRSRCRRRRESGGAPSPSGRSRRSCRLAGLLRFRSGLEQARDVEPDVETDGDR